MTDADWKVERFAAETTEGSISLNTITAPQSDSFLLQA